MAHKRGFLTSWNPKKIIITELSDPAKILLCFLSANRIFSSKTVDEKDSRKLLVMFSWVHFCPLRGESIDIDDGDNSTKRTKCSDFIPIPLHTHKMHFKHTYIYIYIYIYMYACMYVCMYYIYVSMYVCM